MKKLIYIVRIIILVILQFFLRKDIKGCTVYAAETITTDDGYQVAYDNEGSEITAIYSDENNVLMIRGIHNKGTSNIAYVTTGYTLALKEHAANKSSIRQGNYITAKREPSGIADIADGDKIVSHYKITIDEDFINKLFTIWKKENGQAGKAGSNAWWLFRNDLKSGMNVYISNIFAVIKRNSAGEEIYRSGDFSEGLSAHGTMFYTLNTMINAGKELGMFDEWSVKTQKYLPNYYDISFKIYISIYKIDVEFVDTEGKVIADAYDVKNNYLSASTKGYYLPGGNAIVYLNTAAEEIYNSGMRYKMCADRRAVLIRSDGTKIDFNGNSNGTRFSCGSPGKGDCRIQIFYEICNDEQEEPEEPFVTERTTNITKIVTGKNELKAVIGSNIPENEIYDVCEAIPSTEEVYISFNGNKYLYNIELVTVQGKMKIPINVIKGYKLVWKDNEEECFIFDEVEIEREFSYTYVNSYSVYALSRAEVENIIFPEEYVAFENLLSECIPEVVFRNQGDYDMAYCTLPKEYYDGMEFEEEIIGNMEMLERPEFDFEEEKEKLREAADSEAEKIKVKNDYLAINGTVIIDDAEAEEKGGEINNSIESEVINIVKKGIEIPAETKNGVYSSAGHAEYEKTASYKYSYIGTYYDIDNINSAAVYTPVCSNLIVNCDNKKYVQLVNPNLSAVQAVLSDNPETSDMYVSVSNYGYHSDYKGYGTRDYSKYVSGYTKGEILKNQICFETDVFVDAGRKKDISDDILIKAGEWYTVGEDSIRVYLPEYEEEGIKYINSRSIAVNAGTDYDKTEYKANTDRNNYAASDYSKVQVSGRLYGMTIYDISDYPLWEHVFRTNSEKCEYYGESEGYKEDKKHIRYGILKRSLTAYNDTAKYILPKDYGVSDEGFKAESIYDYTAGVNDSYGIKARSEKYTFPLVNSSHPHYENTGMYIPGSVIRFTINTAGSVMRQEGAYIKIIPKFFVTDKSGRRTEVDLYYKTDDNGKQKLVKIGSDSDMENVKYENPLSCRLGMNREELEDTIRLKGENITYRDRIFEMFSYSEIIGNPVFRTYSNQKYVKKLEKAGLLEMLEKAEITKDMLIMSEQTQYFNYSLPAGVFAVQKDYNLLEYAVLYGIDYNEEFIISEGILVVNFEITAYDADGKEYMSYMNQDNLRKGFCCMWETEGAGMSKCNFDGTILDFKYADVLASDCSDMYINYYKSEGLY